MRKYLFSSLLVLVMVVMTACESRTPQLQKQTIDFVVEKQDWQFDKETYRFYCLLSMPEITANIYNYGTWTLNHEYNYDKSDPFQVVLPETTFVAEEIDNGDGTFSIYQYAVHIDYVVGVGVMEIDYIFSDRIYPIGFVPDKMHFHLQLVY